MATAASSRVDSVEPARLTIHYTENEDGWVTAQIVELPAAISQGRSRHEAWVNVLDALRDLTHEPTRAETLAFAVQARIIEPLSGLRDRLVAGASRRRSHVA